MIGRWATRLAVTLLKNGAVSNEDRQLLTIAIMDRLGALPLRARIRIDETGKIFVDEKQLTFATARRLSEGSRMMLSNFARRFVRDQVTYMAIHKGVHENVTPEQGLFAKAAVWNFQEEDELYLMFARAGIAEGESQEEPEGGQERTL